jgi:hypothetical protein
VNGGKDKSGGGGGADERAANSKSAAASAAAGGGSGNFVEVYKFLSKLFDPRNSEKMSDERETFGETTKNSKAQGGGAGDPPIKTEGNTKKTNNANSNSNNNLEQLCREVGALSRVDKEISMLLMYNLSQNLQSNQMWQHQQHLMNRGLPNIMNSGGNRNQVYQQQLETLDTLHSRTPSLHHSSAVDQMHDVVGNSHMGPTGLQGPSPGSQVDLQVEAYNKHNKPKLKLDVKSLVKDNQQVKAGGGINENTGVTDSN